MSPDIGLLIKSVMIVNSSPGAKRTSLDVFETSPALILNK